MTCRWWLVSVLALVIALVVHAHTDEFHEELILRPLPDGKLLAHLQFTTRWWPDVQGKTNYNLFPKSIAKIQEQFGVAELRLSFTQGRWQEEDWRRPIVSAPSGVEVWSRFQDKIPAESVEDTWMGLSHSLSGLFCASLNVLDHTRSSSPPPAFFSSPHSNTSSSHLKYAALPFEAVCTENLTPWTKLLPCRDQKGIGELLNSQIIYNVHYHSMITHLRLVSSKDAADHLELIQSLTLVFDSPSSKTAKTYDIPQLFGRHIKGIEKCPLATTSSVYVDLPNNPALPVDSIVSPRPHGFHGATGLYFFQIDPSFGSLSLRLSLTPDQADLIGELRPKTVTINRFSLIPGEERGQILVELRNHLNSPISIRYLEFMPWYLPPLIHTGTFHFPNSPPVSLLQHGKFKYLPSTDHGRLSVLDMYVDIPASSIVAFSYKFTKSFVIWTEHPPDAHRGFDVPAALIIDVTANKTSNVVEGLNWSPFTSSKTGLQDLPNGVYSETLLVSLPTPDFSMPFNVITFTSTTLSFYYSSIFDVVTRRLVYMRSGETYENKPLVFRILAAILTLILGFFLKSFRKPSSKPSPADQDSKKEEIVASDPPSGSSQE